MATHAERIEAIVQSMRETQSAIENGDASLDDFANWIEADADALIVIGQELEEGL